MINEKLNELLADASRKDLYDTASAVLAHLIEIPDVSEAELAALIGCSEEEVNHLTEALSLKDYSDLQAACNAYHKAVSEKHLLFDPNASLAENIEELTERKMQTIRNTTLHLGQDRMRELADAAGGAPIGGSRATVDNGWLPEDCQIGQTGKTIHPKLYIALGISGAMQHLVGVSGAEYILAINKDARAPILEIADYAIIDDLFKAESLGSSRPIPELFATANIKFDFTPKTLEPLNFLVRQEGFEPPTHGLEGRCSIQLSY